MNKTIMYTFHLRISSIAALVEEYMAKVRFTVGVCVTKDNVTTQTDIKVIESKQVCNLHVQISIMRISFVKVIIRMAKLTSQVCF